MILLKIHLSFLKKLLFFGSIFFLMISIIGLFSGNLKDKNIDDTVSIAAIILDVSKSMNVRDIGKDSRLQEAKKQIFDILSRYNGYQFALNIFAGESQRVLPFSSDISLVATFLQGLDSNNLTKQGTRIDLALQDALASFGENKTGVLIILSDGDENKITIPKGISTEIKKRNIQVFIVGLGTKKGGYIPTGDRFQPYKIYNGRKVVASLNKQELKKVAKILGGKYVGNTEDIVLERGESKNIKKKKSIYLYLTFFLWFSFVSVSVFEIYRK